jgi:hypothetical protein
MRTRSEDELFVAYCPKEFAPLFFSADLVIHIPDAYIKYSKYSEVSETFAWWPGSWGEKFIQLYFSLGLSLIRKVQRVLKPNHLLSLSTMLRTLRTSRYLYQSGVWAWVRADARSRWGKSQLKYGKVIHISDYFVVTPRSLMIFHNLQDSFTFRFNELAEAIMSGMSLRFKVIGSRGPQKQVVMRTRAYSSKATMHNSDYEQTLLVTRLLLERGYKVINIGSPPLSLSLSLSRLVGSDSESRYVELSSPSLAREIQTIMESDFVVTRADAGLFVLMAFVGKPLVTISNEYSVFLGTSLLDARARSGQDICDLNLANSINEIEALASRLYDWIALRDRRS